MIRRINVAATAALLLSTVAANAVTATFELQGPALNHENTISDETLASISFDLDETPFELRGSEINLFTSGSTIDLRVTTNGVTERFRRSNHGSFFVGDELPWADIDTWYYEDSWGFTIDENGDVALSSFSGNDFSFYTGTYIINGSCNLVAPDQGFDFDPCPSVPQISRIGEFPNSPDVATVPLPASALLLGLGLLAFPAARRLT